MELDGSGNVEARYTHVPADAVGGGSCESCGGSGSVWAIDYPLMMRRDSENYFYMKDRLGSIVGLLDDEEDVVAIYEYDAWGNIVAESGSVSNPYRFTAREWDSDTGLYYYRARTYRPDEGRFMQQDPAGMVDGTNMYRYVSNNPANNVDPYGTVWISGESSKQEKYDECRRKYNDCVNAITESQQKAYDDCINDAEQQKTSCLEKCTNIAIEAGVMGGAAVGFVAWGAKAAAVPGGQVAGGVLILIGTGAGVSAAFKYADYEACKTNCNDEYNEAISACGSSPYEQCEQKYQQCIDAVDRYYYSKYPDQPDNFMVYMSSDYWYYALDFFWPGTYPGPTPPFY